MKIKPQSVRDFSKGVWRNIQNNQAPLGSFSIALNMNSDKEFGSLVSRDGTTIIGSQISSGNKCLGLHSFVDSVGSGDTLFAAFSDGTNNDIYDVVAGTKSLEDDTKDLKTRFLTYLDSCVRVNGTDSVKAWNGTSWITTGGAFDLGNWPATTSLVLEWKDRVYTAGDSSNPDTLYYSGVADSATRTVSWTSGNGNIVVEQEDGGGGITALTKVPGYMIIFKRWTMKRWDGNSTYPDDLVNQGVPSQECVCTGRGMCMFINENGFWATNGSYPKKLSKWTVDSFIEAITDWSVVSAYSDDKVARVSIGDVTVDNVSYKNVTIKYNHDTHTFDIYSYPNNHTIMTLYTDTSNNRFAIAGDDDGNVKKLDTGDTDDSTPIFYSLETNDIDFGVRNFIKKIVRVVFFTENISKGVALIRKNSNNEEDYDSLGNITESVEIIDANISANYIRLKITGEASAGNVKILGYAFPDYIEVTQNINE